MGSVPEKLKDRENYPDFTEWYGQDVLELAYLTLYDESGNRVHLMQDSVVNELEYRMRDAQFKAMVLEKLATFGTQEAIGTMQEYVYAYADSDSTHTILSYVTKSVNPRPLSGAQIILYRNGVLQFEGVHWTYGSTGITLATALISTDEIQFTVISPDLARGMFSYLWMGKTGTGTGNRVWTLADLGTDENGNSITIFPSTSSRCWVHRNGVRCKTGGASPDYTFSGSGSTSVVTWLQDIADDEEIAIIIWGT